MWTPTGLSKTSLIFGHFEPIDVLIWHDGPRTFTTVDQDGGLCLAHWLCEDETIWRYVVVPIKEQTLEQLNRGEVTIRDSLDQPRVYLLDLNRDGDVTAVWLTKFSDIPDETLPVPGTMIRRDLESFSHPRSIGESIQPSQIPGSAIKATVEGA